MRTFSLGAQLPMKERKTSHREAPHSLVVLRSSLVEAELLGGCTETQRQQDRQLSR